MTTDGLELHGVNSYYGQSHVLFDVSLQVRPGEMVFLLGRNGAGKSTTMSTACGVISPRSGQVRLDGVDVAGMKPRQVLQRGLTLVPEDRRLFAEMTVRENLAVAQRHARPGSEWTLDRLLAAIPLVEKFLDRKAARLSGGEQQVVAIARALLSNPRILLLDEPMEGLAPLVIRSLEEHLETLRQAGVGLLVSEAQLERVLRLEGRVYVIDRGVVVMTGTTDELRHRQDEVEKYLTV